MALFLVNRQLLPVLLGIAPFDRAANYSGTIISLERKIQAAYRKGIGTE